MLSQEEATKILMEELGYKLKLPSEEAAKIPGFSTPRWIKGNDRLDYAEALAHCLDLNVQAGIWKKMLDTDDEAYMLLDKVFQKDEYVYQIYFKQVDNNGQAKIIQEACFRATAEAIRREK